MKTFKNIFRLPRKAAVLVVCFYQKTLSPDHGWFRGKFPGGYCRYHPSCSDYGKEAFEKYGFFRGLALSLWRVLRCNPWSKGGEDELK